MSLTRSLSRYTAADTAPCGVVGRARRALAIRLAGLPSVTGRMPGVGAGELVSNDTARDLGLPRGPSPDDRIWGASGLLSMLR
ncbi:hypothetical protein AAFN86_13565 [Roseomonas sp. CAU 1739]|uniref:hypothetical protein n=1 Tax=Roseomonas sp. CAU 1739 TaxID=3140364 RepID=UPI00325B920E